MLHEKFVVGRRMCTNEKLTPKCHRHVSVTAFGGVSPNFDGFGPLKFQFCRRQCRRHVPEISTFWGIDAELIATRKSASRGVCKSYESCHLHSRPHNSDQLIDRRPYLSPWLTKICSPQSKCRSIGTGKDSFPLDISLPL